jgi:pimeloyl-ACP methyl ester carboxylesterase
VTDDGDELALFDVEVEAFDDDRIVPTEQSIRLADELPNAILNVIPQSGHLSHEEHPDLFMQAVAEFLSTLK